MTFVPTQIGLELLAIIVILGVRIGLTVMVIPADVAGFPVAHVAFDVKTQVIISPLTKVEFEYVVEFIPTFVPFNFH